MINTLFGLLHQAEKLGPDAKLLVRRRGGQTIGALRLHAGRFVRISSLGDHPSPLEWICTRRPEAGPRLTRLWEGRPPGAAWEDALLDSDIASEEDLRASLLQQAGDEASALALHSGRDRPDLLRLSLDEPPRRRFDGFTGLEVFLEVARGFDSAADDSAGRLYRTWSVRADAAILLLRPQDGGSLPVPIGVCGLEGASIGDLLPICLGAKEACQPTVFVEAGMPPRVVSVSLGAAAWVCVSGEHRLAAFRVDDRLEAARLLGDALAAAR